jgi:hypothetical protein
MMGARAAIVPLLFAGSVVATDVGAGVYRCTDASGKVLYSNEPCEDQGARTAKTFSRKELRPNSVRLPKAPPPAPEPGGAGPGGLIGSLRQKPIDVEQLIREGDPAAHPAGGVRHPVLEKLTGKR